jgi:erythromycin esterase
MKFFFTLIIPFLYFLPEAESQVGIKEYVINNTSQVLTVVPDSTNFNDLEAIGNAIGDKRFVLLGEQSHGDAATFLAKSRLIKYLHEKKGFNVLAFESDFVSITGGWDKLEKNKQEIDSFIKGNIFSIWTRCNTCDNLFYNYVLQTHKTASPLQIAGIDCQLHGSYASINLKKELETMLLAAKYASKISNETATILAYTDSLFLNHIMKDKKQYEPVIAALESVLAKEKATPQLSNWDTQVLTNMLYQANFLKVYNATKITDHYYRDKQMANNIEWLALQKYPNEKIIIWAHNGHIAKNFANNYEKANERNFMMGDFLYNKSSIAKEMYVLGFTSFTGYTQWANVKSIKFDLAKPQKNSFERWINKSYDYAFTDFTKYNELNITAEAFSMKGSTVGLVRHHDNFITFWTKMFDGIFFIRDMYGCK